MAPDSFSSSVSAGRLLEHFSPEGKIRIVLDGLRGADSIAELCRKEGIAQSLYCPWSTEFMEAGNLCACCRVAT
jgi:transposase-like protein